MKPVKKEVPPEEILQSESPDVDPYVLLRRQYKALVARMDLQEQQVSNLQITWDRLLNVSQEPAMAQQEPQPAQILQVAEEPIAVFPAWEKTVAKTEEPDKVKEAKPKKKVRNTVLAIFAALAAIFGMLILAFLVSQGWSCALLGG